MPIVPKPGSEDPHEGEPADYVASHPEETAEDWGWHGEWGKYARIGGWITAAILIVMFTTTHYNREGQLALGIFAGLIVLSLLWDIHSRRSAWRR